ncbi:Sodium/potassium-transporting ATPase subunit alpha [Phytophthora fragariae]|uniref:Sodium/potassium-transporting ATPase subunit alpha n=1 Tax=Phytophthora fragariae TaxID=53985 RepID=A0A6A3L0I6_9STRA|nr:Sodium/potassium-transporting ATPase subunit alpha [Phytophthora fragariae]
MPGSSSRDSHPRLSSADIVAVTTEMRLRQQGRKNRNTKAKDDTDDAKRELVMTEHKQSPAEIFADLGSDPVNGMTTHDVHGRQEVEGLNRLTPPKQTPEIVKYIRELTGLFSMLLWVGGALCILIYGLQGDPNNLYLGIVLFLVVVITGTFSYFENAKSSNLMESFKQMMPTVTTVIREGKSQKIEASQLVRGDIIVLKGGDKVPADIRVLECSDDMTVDNSCLTGEPEPLKRIPDCTDENPLETKNLCFFGTFIPQGSGKGVVVRTGDKTVMGRIAKLATTTDQNMTPIAREINHFVHIIAIVAVVIGVIFFVIGVFLKTDIVTNVVFMIGIIVANVPEGLLATVTVCLSLAANRMAHKSVLVKNLEGVETLGSTSCICSDKTGTLTQNVMTVANLVYDNKVFDAECSITPVGNYDLNSPSFKALQRCATLCNNAVFDEDSKYEKVVGADGLSTRGKRKPFKETVPMGNGATMEKVAWETIGDASESAMIKFCHDKRDVIEYREENAKIKEIPFNSKNKYQLSLHKQDNDDSKPILMVMKGAPERITARCGTVLIDGEVVEMTPERLAEVEAAQLILSKKGMRVLGFAQKVLDPDIYPAHYEFSTDNPNFPLGEKDVDYEATPKPDPKVEEPLCFIGLMALIDPPRPEVPIAVAKCKTAGIRVIMVTGDHPITAKAIAHKVGILWGPTCEDIEEENNERGLHPGDNGWIDPNTAPAIVVPGWTISLDTPVEEWDRILDHRQIVFARTSPQQKLIIVENCQRRKEIVAVTGDGVNDSPALKKADIGIAMGIMGSAVSKEAADMILLDDNFASIVCGVEEGRIIFDNLKKSIAYALAANIPELVPFLLYATVRLPLPLTTVLMLLICLGTDMVPSIAMAYEGAESDIMLRAPRNAETEHLVTKKLIFFAYAIVGMIEAGAGMFTFLAVMNDYGYPPKILPNLGYYDRFGKEVIWCQTEGGRYCTAGGKYKEDGKLVPLGLLYGLANDGASDCQDNYNDTIPTGGDFFDAYIFYDATGGGKVIDCQFPLQNLDTDGSRPADFDRTKPSTYADYTPTPLVTVQSMEAASSLGYHPYYPMAARRSSFFNMNWFAYDTTRTDAPGLVSSVSVEIFSSFQPMSVWAITDDSQTGGAVSALSGAQDAFGGTVVTAVDSTGQQTKSTFELSSSHSYKVGKSFEKIKFANGTDPCTGKDCLLNYRAGFTYRDGDKAYVNIMSRMMQYSALSIAQTAFFIAIVEMQWSNVMICKTRYLSIVSQGMLNSVLNFGLIFEFMLSAVIAYAGFTHTVLNTMSPRLVHWFPALPFAVFLLLLDEGRKFLMRSTSRSIIRKDTGQMVRYPGWLEVNTYY